jgi:hypothetical protein
MKTTIVLVVFFAAIVPVKAQNSPPRSPGRVGGSPNNPSVLRPTGRSGRSAVALDAATVLTAEEQKQFTVVQQSISGVTVYDFFQIEYLSKALQERHVEADPGALAQKIAAKKNHVIAALEQFGIKEGEAKKMRADAKLDAEKRVNQ